MEIENSDDVKREMKKEDIAHTVPTCSGATEREGEPKVKLLKFVMKKYCLIRDISFNNLEDEYELETVSVLTKNVNLVLANPLAAAHSGRGHPSCVHDVSPTKYVEDAVVLMLFVMAPGARGHTICSDLMFNHWNRSLCVAK